MSNLRFVWDPIKARSNLVKHGISLDEAVTAFHDEHAKVFGDPDHSQVEERFILLGMSIRLRVLVVCHCYRESETVVRIISVRKADGEERESYWR
ncbi:MAG: BrnT family toxin [Candidatus Krumholzibacteria bacterium]|nr:BrnT family toxin [Candidatus Krumholzibacteria bacterium]